MNTMQRGMITLLCSAVTGEMLALPEDFQLADILTEVNRHSIATLVYEGAVNCGIDKKTPEMQKLFQTYVKMLVTSEGQLREIQRIFDAFDEAGIDYMPLKGCKLKALYPKPELRAMGDADILIRMEQYDKIRLIMQELGYTEKGENCHELPWQSDELFVELHKCLFVREEKDLFGYFGTGWDLARQTETCRYKLPAEDEYLHLFAHMTKHYRSSGIGSRHILDLYVYRRANPDLDERYIEETLQKQGLLEFYRNIRKLIAVWFEDAQPDEKTEFIGEYIMSSGNWGTKEMEFCTREVKRMVLQGNRQSKFRRVLWALFPPLDRMQNLYRILFKYPKLYPLFWIPRWIQGVFCRPQEILRKFRTLDRVTDEKVLARKAALEYVGLDFSWQKEAGG